MITGWWYEHLNDATSLLPVERRNSRFVSLRVSKFCSVVFSARATSQEVMFTSLTENWLTSIQFIIIMKTRTRGKYIQLQACSRWGLAPQPSTKGSPRLSAPGWPVPKELQRNSQRCIKRTCHIKANSNNLLLSRTTPTSILAHLLPNTKFDEVSHKLVTRKFSVPQIGDTQI